MTEETLKSISVNVQRLTIVFGFIVSNCTLSKTICFSSAEGDKPRKEQFVCLPSSILVRYYHCTITGSEQSFGKIMWTGRDFGRTQTNKWPFSSHYFHLCFSASLRLISSVCIKLQSLVQFVVSHLLCFPDVVLCSSAPCVPWSGLKLHPSHFLPAVLWTWVHLLCSSIQSWTELAIWLTRCTSFKDTLITLNEPYFVSNVVKNRRYLS